METRQASTYTPFTLLELDQFIKRTFRGLRPVRREGSSDYFYDLYLSPSMKVQIWTSIYKGEDSVKDKTRPPMKVIFMGRRQGRLNPEDIRVLRVEKWRDNLRKRVEEFMELYHNDPDGWDSGRKQWDAQEYKKLCPRTQS